MKTIYLVTNYELLETIEINNKKYIPSAYGDIDVIQDDATRTRLMHRNLFNAVMNYRMNKVPSIFKLTYGGTWFDQRDLMDMATLNKMIIINEDELDTFILSAKEHKKHREQSN